MPVGAIAEVDCPTPPEPTTLCRAAVYYVLDFEFDFRRLQLRNRASARPPRSPGQLEPAVRSAAKCHQRNRHLPFNSNKSIGLGDEFAISL